MGNHKGRVSCAHWLSWRIGLDPATAREKVRVARALGNLPAIDAALKSGKLSYAKVRALTRVATPETEAKLLDAAMYSTGAQLERLCRGYRTRNDGGQCPARPSDGVRRRDLPGGMVKLEIVLTPDEADLVLRALDRAREVEHGERTLPRKRGMHDAHRTFPRKHQPDLKRPSRADGMVALAESYLAGNPATATAASASRSWFTWIRIRLHPTACWPELWTMAPAFPRKHSGAWPATAASSPWPRPPGCPSAGARVPFRRQFAAPCSCATAVVASPAAPTTDSCTATTSSTGCTGAKRAWTTFPCCATHHHHLVHEGGWSVERTADGDLCFRAPDGGELAAVPAREVSEDARGFLQEWAEDRGLDIGADTNMPLWDGTRPDYDWAVAALVSEAGG